MEMKPGRNGGTLLDGVFRKDSRNSWRVVPLFDPDGVFKKTRTLRQWWWTAIFQWTTRGCWWQLVSRHQPSSFSRLSLRWKRTWNCKMRLCIMKILQPNFIGSLIHTHQFWISWWSQSHLSKKWLFAMKCFRHFPGSLGVTLVWKKTKVCFERLLRCKIYLQICAKRSRGFQKTWSLYQELAQAVPPVLQSLIRSYLPVMDWTSSLSELITWRG